MSQEPDPDFVENTDASWLTGSKAASAPAPNAASKRPPISDDQDELNELAASSGNAALIAAARMETSPVSAGYSAELVKKARPVTLPGAPADSASIRARIVQLWQPTIEPTVTSIGTLKSSERPSALHRLPLSVRTRVVTSGDASKTIESDFELISQIGRGGMGVIYSARQASMDRTIAFKMITAEVAEDEVIRDKFLTEAAITASLTHPNIVPIYDLGSDQRGLLYYAMKLVEGTPWNRVLRSKRLSDNVEILLRVCDAVAYAHARNIIHRDLKTENVMLGAFGEILVMDWGLAVAAKQPCKFETINEDNALGGTPAYMAPEMAYADPALIGFTSDIYLLGAILYEILTGAPPHITDDPLESLEHAARNEIKMPEGGGELAEIALRAMSTLPDERYQTVEEFQEAVRHFQTHSTSLTTALRAKLSLQRAREKQQYELFAKAVFGYEQAISLWAANTEARNELLLAQRDYAECALKRGDLDLAMSTLTEDEPTHEEVRQKIENAKRKRKRRAFYLTAVARLTFILFVCTLFAWGTTFVWISADRDNVRLDAYIGRISLAEASLNVGDLTSARTHLTGCPFLLRNWEWGRLSYLTSNPNTDLQKVASGITAARLSPDARYLATIGTNGVARLSSAADGAERFSTEKINVTAVAFTGDAKNLITGDAKGHIQVWDALAAKPTLVKEFDSGGVAVRAIREVAQGDRLVVLDEQGILRFIHFSSGQVLLSHGSAENPLITLVASPDENRFSYLSQAGEIVTCLAENGDILQTIPLTLRPGERPTTLSFQRDQRVCVVGTSSGRLILIQTAMGQPIANILQNNPVTQAELNPEGDLLVALNPAGIARVWETSSQREIQSMRESGSNLAALQWSLTGDRILLAWRDGRSALCAAAPPPGRTALGKDNLPLIATVLAPSGQEVSMVAMDGEISAWDALTGHFVRKWPVSAPASAAIYEPNGKRLFASLSDKMEVYDATAGTVLANWPAPEMGGRIKLAFAPDQKTLLAAGTNGNLTLFDTALGSGAKVAPSLSSSPGGWLDAVWADNNTFILADASGSALAYNRTGAFQFRLSSPTPVTALAISPVNHVILTGHSDGQLNIWSAKGDHMGNALRPHLDAITSLAYLPDGSRIATASEDGISRIISSDGGTVLLTLHPQLGSLFECSFSTNSRSLLTGARTGQVLIWNTSPWK